MNKSEQLAEEVVDSQAAQYVARLYSGEMSALEEKALLAWLDADPVHRNAYEKALRIWDAAGELVDDPDATQFAPASGPPTRCGVCSLRIHWEGFRKARSRLPSCSRRRAMPLG